MASIDELKRKTKDAIDAIADVSMEAYKLAEGKTVELAKRAKLSSEIAREKSHIRRIRSELGKQYFELHRENPIESLAPLCEEMSAAYARIKAKRQELEDFINNCEFEDPFEDEVTDDDIEDDEDDDI